MKTSDIIRLNKERILEQWISRVKEQVPEAKEHGYVALRNDMPDLLDDIANNVEAHRSEQDTHESYDHGRLRAAFKNYSLAHVVREYRVMMEVLLTTIDREGSVSISDRDLIIYEVTKAIEEASEVFFQNRQDESEKKKKAAELLVAQLREEGALRDDFIGTVTHDLRNPLANTISLVELLKSRIDGDATNHKLLDAIRTSTNRADTLIRNLLDVNLITSGSSLPISIQQYDLMSIVEASTKAFRESYQVNVKTISDFSTLLGFFDPEMIRRALDNLISNAIKYGDGAVSVTCQQPDEGTARVLVRNEGNPIPINQQDKIFSRHYRATHHASQQGWGIGLSLVQGIIVAHGGSISLVSSEKEGTVFTIQLPIHERTDESPSFANAAE